MHIYNIYVCDPQHPLARPLASCLAPTPPHLAWLGFVQGTHPLAGPRVNPEPTVPYSLLYIYTNLSIHAYIGLTSTLARPLASCLAPTPLGPVQGTHPSAGRASSALYGMPYTIQYWY